MASFYQTWPLLKTESKWSWSAECSDVFKAAKKLLMTAPVLAHYNPSLPIRLAGDASAYRIGAVISHVLMMALKGQLPLHHAHCL